MIDGIGGAQVLGIVIHISRPIYQNGSTLVWCLGLSLGQGDERPLIFRRPAGCKILPQDGEQDTGTPLPCKPGEFVLDWAIQTCAPLSDLSVPPFQGQYLHLWNCLSSFSLFGREQEDIGRWKVRGEAGGNGQVSKLKAYEGTDQTAQAISFVKDWNGTKQLVCKAEESADLIPREISWHVKAICLKNIQIVPDPKRDMPCQKFKEHEDTRWFSQAYHLHTFSTYAHDLHCDNIYHLC